MIIKNEDKKKFCEAAVDLNEKMGGAYFYRPPSNAAGRRSYEKWNSISGEFRLKGDLYHVSLNTDCSCKHVYFSRNITVNGVKKNIKAVKKALEVLNGGK